MSPGGGSVPRKDELIYYDPEVVEKDPTGRYLRYDEVLGKGAFKTVYKAFDEVDGIEVAWNRVKIDQVLQSPEDLETLYSEVHLLRSVKHENIMKFFSSWVDYEKRTINMITELFTSGSLRMYREKHKHVDMKAIKKWARQILKGLIYLHSHEPPIIHRDLKCDNVFVNGNNGEVKIGDLGLALQLQQPTAQNVNGTLEFMAPDIFQDQYNELVDIYSFGMCILEMVTCEYPYSECDTPIQIIKKVTSGIKPASLSTVTDDKLKEFIEKCLAPASKRLSAKELLNDPFLQIERPKEETSDPFLVMSKSFKSLTVPMEIDSEIKESNGMGSNLGHPQGEILEYHQVHQDSEFSLQGSIIDDNKIEMFLRIAHLSGRVKNIHFMFFLHSDTAVSVVSEMVAKLEDLELADHDLAFIAKFIDYLIIQLMPSWKPSSGYSWRSGLPCSENSPTSTAATCYSILDNVQATEESYVQDDEGDMCNRHVGTRSDDLYHSSPSFSNLEDLVSNISEVPVDDSSNKKDETCESAFNTLGEKLGGFVSEHVLGDLFYGEDKLHNVISSVSSCSSLAEKDMDMELKLELEATEAQYQQWFQSLAKMREDTLEATKKRWKEKKSADH